MLSLGRASHRFVRQCGGVRHHMSHGRGGADILAAAPVESGPREPLQLGLEAARASQNILRLLESSHGVASQYADALSPAWHPQGLTWRRADDGEWTATSRIDQEFTTSRFPRTPNLLSLSLSDDRTALAKIQSMDGLHTYVSLLRLDPDSSVKQSAIPNDGWCILREVIGSGSASSAGTNHNAISSIIEILQGYLGIEHGGGSDDKVKAENLFASQASLLAVGSAPLEEPVTTWSAPTGSLLSIPLDTYLEGVASQTPHSIETKTHDAIVQVDVLPCQTTASAIVHVGNGAQTLVFVDHLLLGYNGTSWKILSKTFTTRIWPT